MGALTNSWLLSAALIAAALTYTALLYATKRQSAGLKWGARLLPLVLLLAVMTLVPTTMRRAPLEPLASSGPGSAIVESQRRALEIEAHRRLIERETIAGDRATERPESRRLEEIAEAARRISEGGRSEGGRPAERRAPSTIAALKPPESPSDGWSIVPVFYGTDRTRVDQPKRIDYGISRAHRLELGRALVTVPKAHDQPSTIERPWLIRIPYLDLTLYEQGEDPKRHFSIKEIKALTRDELLALVRERLETSEIYKDHAFVFIHGYYNAFDHALYRTAQIAYDLKFDGAAFLYSWPSGATFTSYTYDRDSAQQAERYLRDFIDLVVEESGAKNVSLIAHSMGSQPLLQVLRDLKWQSPDGPRINQIILAAPDIDRDTFAYLAREIKDVSRGTTLYASSNDFALGVSRRFAGGIPRAGDVPAGGPAIVAGVDTIDISALSTAYLALNHSTYVERTALLQDIELLLRTGERPPEQRFPILKRITAPAGDFWRYP